MLYKLRRRAEDEKGFTLIELLVVILIIGILAAIAIPSFINQRSKATDAAAKELARTAQTAAETFATDHGGSYAGMDTTGLVAIEPSIQIGAANGNAYMVSGTGVSGVTATGYTVTATSSNGNTYSITRAGGTLSRACTVVANGSSGGCVGNTW
jgi:type IV pilus assembly protein PilA